MLRSPVPQKPNPGLKSDRSTYELFFSNFERDPNTLRRRLSCPFGAAQLVNDTVFQSARLILDVILTFSCTFNNLRAGFIAGSRCHQHSRNCSNAKSIEKTSCLAHQILRL